MYEGKEDLAVEGEEGPCGSVLLAETLSSIAPVSSLYLVLRFLRIGMFVELRGGEDIEAIEEFDACAEWRAGALGEAESWGVEDGIMGEKAASRERLWAWRARAYGW